MNQVEQFIESIFPTQDPKALSLIHKGEIAPSDAKKAAEDSEAKKDVFFLLLAVLGTLAVISGLMVSIAQTQLGFANRKQIGAAYLAGARFDIALKELTKGNVFPKAGEKAVPSPMHGEL